MARVTIQDVARAAGVSAMTVSRVLNDQPGVSPARRAQVRAAIEELGYRRNILARGLKAQRSHTLGLVVPDITNPYFPEIVRGAEDVAMEAGYGVFLSNAVEDQERESASLRLMEERRVDGVIVVSPRLPERRLHALLRSHRAAVVVNRSAPPEVAGAVRLDHVSGVVQAIEHVLSLGRLRIGVLAGPDSSFAARERLDGIRADLEARGMPLAPDRVLKSAPTIEGGAEAAARLLAAGEGLDALLCYNDLVAAGALQACAAKGRRVPEDVAVVGFDDIAFARMFTPPLTTLNVPKYDLGVNAMRILLDRISGRNVRAEVVLRPTLVVRGSTVPGTAPDPRNGGVRRPPSSSRPPSPHSQEDPS